MKLNFILGSIITGLVIALIVLGTCYSKQGAKNDLQQLQQKDKALQTAVTQLTASEAGANQDAQRFEMLYISDTLSLAALKYSFDSLATELTKLKRTAHVQIKAIGNLTDAGTDSLYAINKARFSQLVR